MREAGRIRMCFYPLPLSEAQRIRRWISSPEVVSAALDPCVGDGAAFEAISTYVVKFFPLLAGNFWVCRF